MHVYGKSMHYTSGDHFTHFLFEIKSIEPRGCFEASSRNGAERYMINTDACMLLIGIYAISIS